MQCCSYANEYRAGLLIINGNYCAANTQLENNEMVIEAKSPDFACFNALNDTLPISSGENWRE